MRFFHGFSDLRPFDNFYVCIILKKMLYAHTKQAMLFKEQNRNRSLASFFLIV
ncbi:hypothetical protein SAMN04488038_112201 [Solimonas aquatica]|uniref:Uncharacterized protein n=1 Tax=Solimonas aquatica TaxID=489703 RepID=A0A1H9K379_9GAMM|nr:hypothetical protein SAMN04488038_112201 [Solimonas aquatica]